jgi:hypothetical protein
MDIRQTAVDRTAGFESFVGYMYLDTTGNVTIGYGRMLPSAGSATSIALKLNGAPATDPGIAIQSLFDNQLVTLRNFLESAQHFDKFFPNGITKIHVSLKATGVDMSLDLEGPDRRARGIP